MVDSQQPKITSTAGLDQGPGRHQGTSPPPRHVTRMTLDDAGHLSTAQRQAILAAYPPHEREARAWGLPQLGSGRVFPVDGEAVAVAPFAVPAHWPLIGGLDFGWDHPTAAVRLAWDRDADAVYVTHAYRVREATPVIHAAALKPWGDGLPWAWPQDGLQHDKQSGTALADAYRAHGLRLLPEPARFEDGSAGVEAGLMLMLERMQTGRLRVFAPLADWFAEFRLYHRRDGLVVKEQDDLLCATRYALMMLRHARVPTLSRRPTRAVTEYDPFA